MKLQLAAHFKAHRSVLLAIAGILVAYLLATLAGWTSALGEEPGQEPEVDRAAHVWAVLPFTLLLGAIALLPLLGGAAHWWERNLSKFYVAVNLGIITLLYLAFLHPQGGLGFALTTLERVIVHPWTRPSGPTSSVNATRPSAFCASAEAG